LSFLGKDLLGECLIVSSFLESLDDLLEGSLDLLSLEDLHGSLVELKLVNLSDDSELDDDWLSKWLTALADEAELSCMLCLSGECCKLG